ncbi:FAD-dependent oxidoreductase, partial [Prevotella histicola]
VLQQKMASLPNVELFTSTQTTALLGDGTRLTGIRVKDRKTEEERDITLDGIFVQIGLMPNSDVVSGQVELSPRKEIIIDATNRTNVSGVYAAGDVTTVPYKQITIAMGEGAKAALSAFDDRVRGVIQ